MAQAGLRSSTTVLHMGGEFTQGLGKGDFGYYQELAERGSPWTPGTQPEDVPLWGNFCTAPL